MFRTSNGLKECKAAGKWQAMRIAVPLTSLMREISCTPATQACSTTVVERMVGKRTVQSSKAIKQAELTPKRGQQPPRARKLDSAKQSMMRRAVQGKTLTD